MKRACNYPCQLTLNNSINGACLLAETAVNALCHVNVVSRRTTRSVQTGLGLDSDCLSGTDGFAELACNATLLTVGVSPQRVLAAESGRKRSLLERVHDRVWWAEELLENDSHS